MYVVNPVEYGKFGGTRNNHIKQIGIRMYVPMYVPGHCGVTGSAQAVTSASPNVWDTVIASLSQKGMPDAVMTSLSPKQNSVPDTVMTSLSPIIVSLAGTFLSEYEVWR
jgi:hypothetical protein